MKNWEEVYKNIVHLEEENEALKEHVNNLIQKIRELKAENSKLRKEKER